MKCPECQQENRSKAIFCSNCGSKLVAEAAPEYNKHVKKVSVFFFVLLGYIALLHATHFQKDFQRIVIADALFVFINFIFFVIHFKEIKGLFNVSRLQPKVILITIITAVCTAFAVYYFVDFINNSLFDRTQQIYYEYYKDSPFPLLMCILSIGVVPAVFEEIGMRGILFSELLKITNKNAVIFITSILFTLLHFSVLSVFWIFPGALCLGYLRARYNTVNYGILAHFTYNTSIVLLEMILSK